MAKRYGQRRFTRRRVLQGLGGAATAAAIGCGSDVTEQQTPTTTAGVGGAGQGGSTTTSNVSSSTSSQGGGGAGGAPPASACDDTGGLSAQELLAPIDTVVVLMMENRSFDHYLGGSLALVEGRTDIVGLTGMEKNPGGTMGDVAVYHMMNMQPDSPPHSWNPVHAQWNMGMNDGFVTQYGGNPEVMGYYVRDQLPIHHAIADAHVVCNSWHCSVLGPTWPNRFYLHGCTSNGQKGNFAVTGFQSLWGPLKDAGLTVRNYHHGVAWCMGGYVKFDDLANFDAFKADAAAGNLPNFSIIDPQFFGTGANDDHPTNHDIPLAQLLISDVYTTLAMSPQWSSCLLLVIYDEHGGFFDHVAPPTATDDDPEFAQMGFRIPGLIAGPYVRKGCAVNTVFDHASVAKTLSARFGIQPLNARHAAANDVSSAIDPSYVTHMSPQPPTQMPTLSVSMSALRRAPVPHDQHPELIESLRQQGLWRSISRKLDLEGTLKRHLDDCARKGIARLLP